jgi:FkbM family methyltransferase
MKRLIKKPVKLVFGLFNLEIRSRSGRRTTMADVLTHIGSTGFQPRTVIDVGVAYGTPELYKQFPDASHLLIEPLREYESVLQEISRRVRAEYIIAAAGPRAGSVTLNVHDDLSGSSTLKETEAADVDGEPRQVPTIRVDAVCKEKQLEGPFLLKVDVQGAELSVLEGASEILDQTEVVILEVSLFRFYEGGPQFSETVAQMKTLGYVVYDIFGGHYRPLDNALAQVDLVFVKERGAFRRSHVFSTPSQRASAEQRV